MKKNFLHIDEIRFLMIHLILVNHSFLSYAVTRQKVDQALINYSFEITSPILAMLSGYLFFYGSAGNFGFGEKLKRRVPSLILPYVIWSVGFYFIYYIIKTIATHWHLHFWYTDWQPLSFAGVIGSLKQPPMVNFWYLQNLILILPFNFLFYYILKSRLASYIFFAAILGIYAYHPFDLFFNPRFLPYYMMGAYFGYHRLRVPAMRFPFPVPKFQTRFLTSVCFVPLILFLSVETGFWEYDGLLVILIKIAVVLFIVVSIWNLFDTYPNNALLRYLQKYKPYSFFLFAIHTFIFSAVQRPLFFLAGDDMANKYFTLGITLLSVPVVLLVSLALGVLIKKTMPRFFGVITGR